MEEIIKTIVTRKYLKRDFLMRVEILEKTIGRKLNIIERLKLMEKIVNTDNKRLEKIKTLKPCWKLINKPKIENGLFYDDMPQKPNDDIKGLDKEEHKAMLSVLGWDRD